MIKKLKSDIITLLGCSVVISLFVSSALTNTVSAATNESLNPSFSNIQSFQDIAKKELQPQVYITEVNIGNIRAYKAGDTITGTFTLYNYSDFDVKGTSYNVRLVGGLENNSNRIYGELKGDNPIDLKSKENKTISFIYSLPRNFSGSDLSIFVQSNASDGFSLGWKTSDPFEVTGGGPYLDILSSSVRVSDGEMTSNASSSSTLSSPKFYPTQSAPFIYKDKYPQKAAIQFILENKSKETITVIPSIDISNILGSSSTPYHTELKDQSITVEPNKKSTSIALDLPNFNWAPGVYKGIVSFKNLQGEEQSDRVEFLYTVGGVQYNVVSLSAEETQVQKDGTMHLKMNYSGSPFDTHATDSLQSNIYTAVLDTVLFNEFDEKIGENSENINFVGEQNRTFNIQSLKDARAVRAEVSIVKNNSVINKYDFKLSPDYDAVHDTYKDKYFKIITYIIAGILIVSGILFVLVSLVYKRRFTYKRK